MSHSPYRDRAHAGAVLGERLAPRYGGRSDVVVLALPRGGVPVGAEVARMLAAPLDVLVVRKLGVPWHRELAFGAVSLTGPPLLDPDIIRRAGLSDAQVAAVVEAERARARAQEVAFRGKRPPPELTGRTVVIVDDGLATGATMRAALGVVLARHPAWLVAAAPVGAQDTIARLSELADDVVCPSTPHAFRAVSMHYQDFRQTTDDEVRELLDR